MPATRGLERATEQLLRLLEGPLPKGQTVLGRLDSIRSETGRPVHSDLLKLLTHLAFPNDVARRVWSGYQIHRGALSRRLGRDVGPRVALFDYLMNVDRRLTNPKIIELSDFEKTERSALTDHLTGLFNRAHFDGSLKREVNRCRRYGQRASLVVMDLDDFKLVNDQHGHQVGDAVLKEVGRLLGQKVRDIDIAARYGGEEFAIILPETGRMSAFLVAERIRNEIERFFRRRSIARQDVPITVSGGVAAFPADAEGAEGMVARADEALYRAKRAGKNRVSLYYKEKRRASRVDAKPLSVRVDLDRDPSTRTPRGRVVNISAGGLLLETPRRYLLGQSLEIRLSFRGRSVLSLTGQVVRMEERQDTGRRKVYDTGVKFSGGRRKDSVELSRFLREAASAGA